MKRLNREKTDMPRVAVIPVATEKAITPKPRTVTTGKPRSLPLARSEKNKTLVAPAGVAKRATVERTVTAPNEKLERPPAYA